MECKGIHRNNTTPETGVLIETSWNVKICASKLLQSRIAVLIETSWNVKKTEKTSAKATARVLIETSWNVKVFLDIEDKCQENCINRNIVECKESFPEGDLIPISVLIETSWNVKQTSSFSE